MIRVFKKLVPLRLKRLLKDIFCNEWMPLPDGERALIFLAADYGNIGDLAISEAQQQFLARVLPRHSVVPVPISRTRAVLGSIRKQIMPKDVVTIIGGGNMGSLYPDIEELRQLVIRSFTRNRVVCFPQTLDWEDSDASRRALDRIVRTYSRHPSLHVFARESVSFARLCELFRNQPSVKLRLVPDIVLSATADSLGASGIDRPRGALLCLRDDQERSLSERHRDALQRALANVGLEADLTDTHVDGVRLLPERRATLLAEKITQFQAAQIIVTDRLHGMILAALAGTPCLVLPNSNHKICQTWQDWLSALPTVRYLGLDELSAIGMVVHDLLAVPRRDGTQPVINPSHYAALAAALNAA